MKILMLIFTIFLNFSILSYSEKSDRDYIEKSFKENSRKYTGEENKENTKEYTVELIEEDTKLRASRNFEKIEDIILAYDGIGLEDKISFNAFKQAVKELNKIENRKNNIITIVDFTKPSTEKRMFIIDLDSEEILISTYVSHGRGTGGLYAENFSNKDGTNKSSAGFFLTGNIYKGRNGKSLELYGLEKNKNDNVRKRNIVIHGADYANPEFIEKYGRLGRSLGCLAVPTKENSKIIDIIYGNTVIYVHTKEYEDKEYNLIVKM